VRQENAYMQQRLNTRAAPAKGLTVVGSGNPSVILMTTSFLRVKLHFSTH
jgi:hypothetical protein